MVEHERSLRNLFGNTVERELDLPEIEFGTLALIGFLGNEHFTVTLLCMPPGDLAFYGRITQQVARCKEILPDEFGVTPLLLWSLAVPFKDAMDRSSNFRCDDATGLVDLPIMGYDLFDHAFPGSLSAENILPDGVMRDTHVTGCLAIRACSLIGFK